MHHEVFHYKNIEGIRAKMQESGVWFPLSEKVSVLKNTYNVYGQEVANLIAFQPMEGSDGTPDGAPGDFTFRRYERFAKSGCGMIWFEAVAATQDGRASQRQLYLTEQNADQFKRLIDMMKEQCHHKNGFEPLIIMQASHSGRYSKPNGVPEPLIAYNNPLFEKDAPIDTARILTDAQLEKTAEAFGHSARLAAAAGFDGVDIKACHRYLANELLSAYTRPGKYGGSFENRVRFLLDAFAAAKSSVPTGFPLTTRLNVYDGFPHPYGFGVDESGSLTPVLDEPLQLIELLRQNFNLELINITIGNPYVNPHVNRPYDHGNYVPEEHPFEGLARLASCSGVIQKAFPDLAVMCSGLSYLRAFSGDFAAGMIEEGMATFAGFGRLALAYPDFPADLLHGNGLDLHKVCTTCGQCAKLLRAGRNSGCVVRDRELYKALRE